MAVILSALLIRRAVRVAPFLRETANLSRTPFPLRKDSRACVGRLRRVGVKGRAGQVFKSRIFEIINVVSDHSVRRLFTVAIAFADFEEIHPTTCGVLLSRTLTVAYSDVEAVVVLPSFD